MGRIISDGALFFHLVDVAVDPAHQGNGLGKTIVATLLAYVRKVAPAEAYVSLMANGEAHRLYAPFGFTPVMPEARGMALWSTADPAEARIRCKPAVTFGHDDLDGQGLPGKIGF